MKTFLHLIATLAWATYGECAGLSFLTLGDWGGAALEEDSKPYHQNVIDVAKAMDKSATQTNAKFIVNTGDNFYWCGIQNITDMQVAKDWLEPYAAASLQVPWYGVLGNHEYGYNASAQLDLAKHYKNWIMDARYYTRRLSLSADQHASFIFLDTNPCISEYRADKSSGWDPCSSQYPTCSLSGGKDDFEGPCLFHDHIITQDCTAQFTWFKKALAAVPRGDWLIVVGHHAADEIDVEDFATEMQKHGFDLYLNGHIHALTHYQVDGSGAYVTSGAGSLVITHDQKGGTPAKDRVHSKANGLDAETLATVPYGANASAGRGGHTYSSVFNAKRSGFTQHTFNDDYTVLTTQFVATDGSIIHEFNVTKGQDPGPSPPVPTPPGPPAPAGSCCYYHSATCANGAVCCSSSARSYSSQSSCKKYGKAHHCVWSGTQCVVKSSQNTTHT